MNKDLPSIVSGSKVGLISPAGPVTRAQIQKGLDTLAQKNIRYEIGKHAFSDKGLVSATAEQRIEDIHRFLTREDLSALWALRGGYGSIQLLDKLDYALLESHPKLMIGFSDLTALQWAVFKQTGIPSLSGFTLTSQFSPENPFLTLGLEMLSGNRSSVTEMDLQGSKIKIVTPGEAEGVLIGGTLSIVCSLCGTPYFVDRDDLIVFLEDINEPPYRIDRFFQQLALMGFWSKVKGVILGQFLFEGKPLSVAALLKPLLPSSVPIVSDFPYGHQANCNPLLQGVWVSFGADPFRLEWNRFLKSSD